MLPQPSELERDRSLLLAARHDPAALQELSDRYYTDIFRAIQRLLGLYAYPVELLDAMTLDCLGKLCDAADWVLDYYGDLDTAVVKTASLYARIELRNALSRR